MSEIDRDQYLIKEEPYCRSAAKEGGVDANTAEKLVQVAQRSRNLKGHGLDEGMSTRLPVYAAQLIGKGIDPQSACRTHGHYAPSCEADSEEEVFDENMERIIRSMLLEIGEDPSRDGLQRTPLRVAKALDFLTSGYQLSAEDIIKSAVFAEDCKEMVTMRSTFENDARTRAELMSFLRR